MACATQRKDGCCCSLQPSLTFVSLQQSCPVIISFSLSHISSSLSLPPDTPLSLFVFLTPQAASVFFPTHWQRLSLLLFCITKKSANEIKRKPSFHPKPITDPCKIQQTNFLIMKHVSIFIACRITYTSLCFG